MTPPTRAACSCRPSSPAWKTVKVATLVCTIALALLATPIAGAATTSRVQSRNHSTARPVSSAPSSIRAAVAGLVGKTIPGVILFVRQGDHSYTVTAGYANKVSKVPMRATDTYPIGSTTKSYTAVLVMRLVAEGKLRLNAHISTYLPHLLPFGNEITVAELLSHMSGLYQWDDDPSVLKTILTGHLNHKWTPQQAIKIAIAHGLQFKPGTRFNYTETDYFVLSLLAEHITGQSWETQLRDYIFNPLKLTRTRYPTGGTLPDVHGYVPLSAYDSEASTVPIDTASLSPTAGWAASGLRSTVEDVANFYRGLFSGKLLPRAQLAEMENTAPTGGQYGLGLMPTGGDGYVWGTYTEAINTTCGRAWGHGGNWPGYYELPISSPDGSRQAVLLVNADPNLMTQAQLKQIYRIFDAAYCRGVSA